MGWCPENGFHYVVTVRPESFSFIFSQITSRIVQKCLMREAVYLEMTARNYFGDENAKCM